jgi:prepilin-type N-terminal cleavage/methylation domain-containing protein
VPILKPSMWRADAPGMRRRPTFDAEQGFTLVELMVAALVLAIGMAATLTVLNTGLKKTTLNAERVAATNLARELTETARQADYDELTPTQLAGVIQAANTNLVPAGSVWKLKRRNTDFTIEASVCVYDDPVDLLDANTPDNRCALAAGTPTTTGDNSGDDFRRVSFNVRWTDSSNKAQLFKQSALIVNPAGGLGPRINEFTGPAATITTGTTASFVVKTTYAEAVHWNADDGVSEGDATGGHTLWSINWDLKNPNATDAILDGSYVLTAQAFDDRNIAGDAKVATVNINRSEPFAPTGLVGGHNTRVGDLVDLEWSLNKERDIIGYRVYYAGADKAVGGGDDVLKCPIATASPNYLPNTATTCQDLNPPSGAATYYIVALDNTTPISSPREGAATKLDVGGPNAQPDPPTGLTVSGVDTPTLDWTAPSSGSVAFYRIYRDGTDDAHRIGKATATTWTDTAGDAAHTYYVSAVDAKYNESSLVSVNWNP